MSICKKALGQLLCPLAVSKRWSQSRSSFSWRYVVWSLSSSTVITLVLGEGFLQVQKVSLSSETLYNSVTSNGSNSVAGENNTVRRPNNRSLYNSRLLGDILYLNAAGQPVIVINSLKIAGDLLDRRATIYSERPRNIVAGEFITGGLFLTFVNHSDPL